MTEIIVDKPLSLSEVGRALLPLLNPGPDWEKALCRQVDPDLWFPEKGGSTRDPKAICADCPIRPECLEYALEKDERFGVWGGMSERERRRIKRERAQREATLRPAS
jgi:WhiB family redox-sensing transcriptional regulator